MKRVLLIVAWLGVAVVAAWLRFEGLGARPFHCDEATGARITAKRMESGAYRFDPLHYHGPTLSGFAMAVCRLRGEDRWSRMSKETLRVVPAVAGVLVVMVPWLGRRRWGEGGPWLAAAWLAVSPLLVYYSRMFIHEMLLVLFGLLAWHAGWGRRRLVAGVLAGLWTGLMFATKESFAISLLAWAGAGALVAWENRRGLGRAELAACWRAWRGPLAAGLAAGALAAAFFYTDWFRRPQGAWDSVRTFFVYRTTEGHDKPFWYYFHLLWWPKRLAGAWWCEAAVLGFAAWAYVASCGRDPERERWRLPIRFLAYAAAGHFAVYATISYKVPWLACLAWAHVCLLAGFGAAVAWRRGGAWRWGFAGLALAGLLWQAVQARQACGRLASDARNPYAYVPTSADIESLGPWLHELAATVPEVPLQPMGVIGEGYWPLPWYLREYDKIGYWAAPPPNLERLPLVFAVPDSLDAVLGVLGGTHTPLPRGLRSEVPVTVFVRNDLWARWMGAGAE